MDDYKAITAGIVVTVLTALVGFVGERAYQNGLERSGVGKEARRFAKSCEGDMNAYSASFHFGAPSVKVGCVCIGVKLQERGAFDRFERTDLSKTYTDFIFENRAVMNPRKHAEMLSTPDDPIAGIDIRYSQKPKLTPIPHTSPEAKDRAAALTDAYAYCHQYSRDGIKRVDTSRLPDHLR